ncbi:hypothetical protein [Rathayibacter sp. AY1E1]|uniref:hypothetical protein n=1 Tax=Rathayibacter sp. AY1E1 TaxID=2080549 RepID=UPI000CE75B8E|nr:hypothetical protein [Rathayibacter sp. AY1E1]PPH50501.1 hypothetical protein C5C67_13485 [Rathayibacter sp. AY1E1]
MTTDHDFLQDPGTAPTRLGRGGVVLRDAVHRLVAPWFEQARLRTEELRAETAALRDEVAGLRGELSAAQGDVSVLRNESAGLREALDELSASVAADRASSEAAGAAAAEQAADTAAALDERVRGAELELRAVTRRLAEALDR